MNKEKLGCENLQPNYIKNLTLMLFQKTKHCQVKMKLAKYFSKLITPINEFSLTFIIYFDSDLQMLNFR